MPTRRVPNMNIDNLTPAMKRVLSIASIEAIKDHKYLGSNHVLIAMLVEGTNAGSGILGDAGFVLKDMRQGKWPTHSKTQAARPARHRS
jgi:Clp amino terminal domain, pathogenicity island component